MEEKFELLQHVYQDSSMGVFTLTTLLKDLKEKDNKLKKIIEDILKNYNHYMDESKELLKKSKIIPKEEGFMAKMGASMGIHKEVNQDNSDASIADMLIQGISMGSLEIEKKLKAYEKEVDKKHKELANNFLKFQQETIEQLKKYL